MNFKFRHFALLLPLGLALGACDKDFDEINTNPNNPEQGDPAFILTNAERANIFRLFDIPANQDGALLIVQHWAKVQYTTEDRYSFRPSSYQSIWDGFYAGGLEDFNELVRQGEATNNPNLQAVGIIMRSYFFSVLTDIYGDIPYTEALRLRDKVLVPKYDPQATVYAGLLADLKRASGLINPAGPEVGGDAIYGGDMENWQRFANSLRLRLAMRIADADETEAKKVVQEIFSTNAPLISSNAQNAELIFAGTTPNTNPIYENRLTRDDHRISRSMVNSLRRLNDPRLAVYANHPTCGDTAQAWGDSTTTYRGMPNGLTSADAAAYGPLCSTSKVGDYFTAAEAPGVLLTYAEVLFFKSEAIARNFIAGDAASEYQNAITASMEQYGFSGPDVTAYLNQPSVAYDPANFKRSIGTQKWIALYGQGVEAWSEWRRLDAPALSPAKRPVAASGGLIPVRFLYPANEQTVNQTNYTLAVTRQGPDKLTTKVWWDKN